MREQLLEKLAEPETGASLDLKVARGKGGTIEEGELVSQKTGKVYPIVRGIPRFVDKENYSETFGFQWNAYREVQIDSEAGDTNSYDRFVNETGWSNGELKDKWVLDAGCGAGRFAEIAAGFGANLVGLDMSSAIDATAKTIERFPNVQLVQASLLTPPFKPGSFDYAYCIGVIQHTPDPRMGIRSVASVVKPGGRFAFTIYARRPWTKLNAKYLVRPLTKRLSPPTLKRGIETIMPWVFPITDRLFGVSVIGHVARFMIPVATYLKSERPRWTDEQRMQEAILDTFDMLSPAWDQPMTWKEVTRELQTVGVSKHDFKTKVPIIVTGTR
jgi:2-polyprenyl-3-methyl-5-hydroxy-6-metoxy-1,4-benzoquinol methylase